MFRSIFGNKAHRLQRANVVIDKTTLNELKQAIIRSDCSVESNGVTYVPVLKKCQDPFGFRIEMRVCKLSIDKNNSIHVEVVQNLNEVSLDTLRELDCLKDGSDFYTGVPVYDFTERIARLETFDEDSEDERRAGVSFSVHERCEIPVAEDFINGWLYCEKRLGTHEREVFREFKGNLPQPGLEARRTYIADGDYYILYGGLIPMINVPKETLDALYLEMQKFEKLRHEPKHWSKEDMNDCFYWSDAIWKYQVVEDKWELMSPDTNDFVSCRRRPNHLPRPVKDPILTFHHHAKRKIYYHQGRICNCGELFEYDYQYNKFRNIEFPLHIREEHYITNGIIDFSNDTLLLLSSQWMEDLYSPNILVLCLQTNRFFTIKLKPISKKSLWHHTMAFLDNFEKLIFIQSDLGDCDKGFVYVDWGDVKRKTLNPFLQKQREKAC